MTAAQGAPTSRLVFLLREQAARFASIPPAAGEQIALGPMELEAILRRCANDTFSNLVVVGWAEGALELLAADPVARDKRITWLIRSGDLTRLEGALATHDRPPERISVAVCESAADTPVVLERLPPCWGLAVLDPRLCTPGALAVYARHRFQRMRAGMPRKLRDIHSLLERLPSLSESIPLGRWKGAFAGASALCVAAGPSLDRRMTFLRDHMGDCVVIAVDAVQKRLQAAGIRIDFVINVDSDPLCLHLVEPPSDSGTTLVMSLSGHRGLDGHFARRTYFDHGPAARWLLGDDHDFTTGTTVGVTSVGFARHLGCAEVVLLGHDLAFADECYSHMVPEALREYVRLNPTRECLVPGNGGVEVRTNPLYEVGIYDLASVAGGWTDGSVFNPNIGDGIGARIDGTVRLPKGWAPQPLQRADRDERFPTTDLDRHGPDAFVAEALKQAARAAELWREAEVAPHQVALKLAWFLQLSEVGIAIFLLCEALHGPLLHLLRLESLPPSIGFAWQRKQVLALVDEVVGDAPKLISGFLDPKVCESLTHHPAPEGGAARFFMALQRAQIGRDDHPASAVLCCPMSAFYGDLLYAAPHLAVPPPHCADEGLMVLQQLHVHASRRYLLETLSLCALEEMTEPLTWAREGDLIPGSWLIGQENADAPAAVAATDAILRLRRGAPPTFTLVQQASTWPPARLHLVRALVAAGEAGCDALQRLLSRREIETDDQAIALILLNAPIFDRACAMIAPYSAVFGEATTLAMAQRRRETGDSPGALRLARGFRPLSRFADEARLISCECLRDLGDSAGAADQAAAIVDDGMRTRAVAVSAASARQGIESLATAARTAWTSRDRAALTCLRDQLHGSIDPARAELAAHVAILLRHLGG